MKILRDQIGNHLNLPGTPSRIVSLVPSITETLADIGLLHQICGVTRFCIHPSGLKKQAKIIGGTKNPDIKRILALQPDIIFANKEENRPEDITLLTDHVPVYVSDISCIKDTMDFIQDLNDIFDTPQCSRLIHQLQTLKFDKPKVAIRVCYLIWQDPYMTIGDDTFIHDMLHISGFYNVFEGRKRYPVITIDDINDAKPQVVMLSSEPYPFKEKHMEELKKVLHPMNIILVDGEKFSWYGSGILKSPPYFSQLHEGLINLQK